MWIPEWAVNMVAALWAIAGLSYSLGVVLRWWEQRGWIEWKGGSCPIPPDTWVEVKRRDGFVYDVKFGTRGITSCAQHGTPSDIIAYRIPKG